MSALRLRGTFWPSEHQELLLVTALAADDERAAAAWTRLRPTLDLDRLEPGSFGLLPLVQARLEALRIDDPDRPRLHGIRRRTWSKNQLLAECARPLLTALDAAGVAALLLGSLELPLHYYGDLGLRDAGEIQLLVRADAFDAALAALGCASPAHVPAHGARLHTPDGGALVLLRRRCPQFPEAVPDSVWDAALDLDVGRAASATDELLHTCLRGTTASALPNVLWIADAAVVIRNASNEIDWSRLAADARALHATPHLRDALRYVAVVADLQLPGEVAGALGQTKIGRRERLAHRLSVTAWPGLRRAPAIVPAYLRARASGRVPGGVWRFVRDERGA